MLEEAKPYAEYRSTGLAFLSSVPAHWRVYRLRNVCKMLVSNVDKNSIADEIPVRLCNYVDVYKNDRITERLQFMVATATRDEIDRFSPNIGDVIITKDSEDWKDIGVPSLVTYEAPDFVCGYHLALLKPYSKVMRGDYLFRALLSQAVAYQFQIAANGVTRYGLSQGSIKSVQVPVPSLEEQSAIVRVLDHVDHLIAIYAGGGGFSSKQTIGAFKRGLVGRGLELLSEFRTRLIADLVTGKLDVRAIATDLPEISEPEPIDDAPRDDEFDDLLDSAENEEVAA